MKYLPHASATLAEFVCIAEDKVALKPTDLSCVQAAAVPTAATTALQGFRDIGILRSQEVSINGVWGGVGTFAVQIVKTFGVE